MNTIKSGDLVKPSIVNKNFTLLKNSINVTEDVFNYLLNTYSSAITPITNIITTTTFINNNTIDSDVLNTNFENIEDLNIEFKTKINDFITEQSFDVDAITYTYTLNDLITATQITAEPLQENFTLSVNSFDAYMNKVINIIKTEDLDVSLIDNVETDSITKTTTYDLSQITLNIPQTGTLIYNSSNNKERYLTLLYTRLGGGYVGVKYDLQTKTIIQTTNVLNENLPSNIGDISDEDHYTIFWAASFYNNNLILYRYIESYEDTSTPGREYIDRGFNCKMYNTNGETLVTSAWLQTDSDTAERYYTSQQYINYTYNNLPTLVCFSYGIAQNYDYSDEEALFIRSLVQFNGTTFSVNNFDQSGYGRENTGVGMVYTLNNNKLDFAYYIEEEDYDPYSGRGHIYVYSYDISTGVQTTLFQESTQSADYSAHGNVSVEGQVIQSYWRYRDINDGERRCRFVYSQNGSIVLDTGVINNYDKTSSFRQFSHGSEHYFKENITGYTAFFGVDLDTNTKTDITEYSDLPSLTNIYYVNSNNEKIYYTLSGNTITFWNESNTYIDYKVSFVSPTLISNVLYVAKDTIKPFYNDFLTTHLNQDLQFNLIVKDETNTINTYTDLYMLENKNVSEFIVRLILPYYKQDTTTEDFYYFKY